MKVLVVACSAHAASPKSQIVKVFELDKDETRDWRRSLISWHSISDKATNHTINTTAPIDGVALDTRLLLGIKIIYFKHLPQEQEQASVHLHKLLLLYIPSTYSNLLAH